MSSTVEIRYLGFYDVPLHFLVSYADQQIMFDRPFDEEADEYPDTYSVHLMPGISDEEFAEPYADLIERAIAYLGQVPVKDVGFDETKRRSIGAGILDEVLARPRQAVRRREGNEPSED